MKIADNLRREMDKARITQYALEKLSGVPQPTIQRILKGSDPRASTVEKLAAALNISAERLLNSRIDETAADYKTGTGLALSGNDAIMHYKSDKTLRRVPVLTQDEIITGSADTEKPADQYCPAVNAGPRAYALLASDIPNPNDRYGIDTNAYIIIDPDQQPTNGKPVLIKDNNDQLIIRRYELVGKKCYLAPHNEKYEPIEMDDTLTILGRIIGTHNVF